MALDVDALIADALTAARARASAERSDRAALLAKLTAQHLELGTAIAAITGQVAAVDADIALIDAAIAKPK